MTTDYGGGRKKQVGPPLTLILIVGVVLVIAVVVGGWFWNRPREIAKAQLWAIKGPPCQALTRQQYEAQPMKVRRQSDVDGMTFGRGYGSMSCEDIVDDGGRGLGKFTECQFTAPAVLQVTTKAGDAYFLVPLGHATVTVKDGHATCVNAGWFIESPNG
jgi:hypothetical protein